MHNVDSAKYWEGYNSALANVPWNRVPYAPGTAAFHKFLEGHADGLKAKHLYKHRQTA